VNGFRAQAQSSEPCTIVDADLETLTGIRSGKGYFYPEYRSSAERLERVIQALDRISRALVRTREGPETLVRAVVQAAAEHLTAEYVLFAVADGALPDTRLRQLVVGPDGSEVVDPATLPDAVLRHLTGVRAGTMQPHEHSSATTLRHSHVPVSLDGVVVGAFVAWAGRVRDIDATDLSVLRILAGQTAAALQNSSLYQRSEQLLAQTEQLYDRASRHADDLAARNAELQRAQEQLLVAQQRTVLDSERRRIARELHDSVTQYALSAGMQIEICRAEMTDPALVERLDTAKSLTRRAVEQLRSAIYTLNHTETAEHASLPTMLEELATVHVPDELRVEVRVEGAPVPLPGHAEHSLLRVAGEALFNTAVHAHARRAVVRLAYRADRLLLSVADDGCGDPETVRRRLRVAAAGDLDGRHRGLANMQSRARQLGGRMSVRRAPLGGLRVLVSIPLPPPEAGLEAGSEAGSGTRPGHHGSAPPARPAGTASGGSDG
jgi:signal transduction histidine kinase